MVPEVTPVRNCGAHARLKPFIDLFEEAYDREKLLLPASRFWAPIDRVERRLVEPVPRFLDEAFELRELRARLVDCTVIVRPSVVLTFLNGSLPCLLVLRLDIDHLLFA